MLIHLLPFLAILAITAPCQVSVQVTTTKPTYLVGEPIWVVAEVRNVGTAAVGRSGCDWHSVSITVENTAPRQTPNVWGCSGIGSGVGGSYGCGTEPLALAAGGSFSYQTQLTDYFLNAGTYTLHVKGRAPVVPISPSDRRSNSIDGAAFEAELKIEVSEGSDEELLSVYAPYLAAADASNKNSPAMLRARGVIVEMAPAILEKIIYGFALDPQATPSVAARGLGHMATADSRRDLVALYNASGDLALRQQIITSLAYQATPEQLDFFQDVLPGWNVPTNDDIRQSAALGLGHIGGDAAVPPLTGAAASHSAGIRLGVAAALGNTRSAAAVPALIDMASDPDDNIRQAVCGSIRGLTHYQWCDGSSGDMSALQSHWRHWWDTNGSRIELHGDQECPAANATLPRVP